MLAKVALLLGALSQLLVGISDKLTELDKKVIALEKKQTSLSQGLRLGTGGTILPSNLTTVVPTLSNNSVVVSDGTGFTEDSGLSFDRTTNVLTTAGGFISSASSTISSNLLVGGVFNASSTLSVTGRGFFGDNLAVGTTSATTGSDLAIESTNATSAIYIVSTRSDRGGCIQLEGPASTTYRLYINGATPSLVVETGSCKGN